MVVAAVALTVIVAVWFTVPSRKIARRDAPPQKVSTSAASLIVVDEVTRTFNVLLITVDTLRYDLGFMGNEKPISPNLDALAEKGTVFERVYATASYTPKSLGPMLAGRYASETWRDFEHFTTFYGRNVMLGERIKQGGGFSFAAMCHHYFAWDTGLNQGFDRWDTSSMPAESKDNDPTVTGDKLTDAAIALLKDPANVAPPALAPADSDGGGGGDRRFFAWFHYLDPHIQYVAHEGAPSFVSKDAAGNVSRERNLYDQEVWFTDQQIGRLLDFVASQPFAKDTAIIVTADHGEAFGERGFYKHGRELWEPLVRVPFVVYVPGAKGRRIAARRSHIDLVPTVLGLMGITVPDGELRGRNLLLDIRMPRDEQPEERDAFMDMPEGPYNESRRAVITGRGPGLKLIAFPDDHYELYDLEADPEELRNIQGNREKFALASAAFKRIRDTLQEIPPSR